jgi:hypothetical protein
VVLILAGCGGSGEEKPQVARGDGYLFHAPAGWKIARDRDSVRASHGDVDLVSVRTFRLLKAYRPALFVAASQELDRVATQLARQLKGRVAARRTMEVGGRKTRSYEVRYGDQAQEITFVLDGRREYQLLCRRDADSDAAACDQLVRTFRLG